MAAAAQGGSYECIDWLQQQNCPWDDRLPHFVALHGRLELLQLVKRNHEWPGSTMLNAIRSGSLACVQWLSNIKLKDNPSLDDCMGEAIAAGHLHLVRWFDHPSYEVPYWCITFHGRLEILQYFAGSRLLNDALTHANLCLAIQVQQLHIVRWLVDSGLKKDTTLMVHWSSVRPIPLETVQWFHKQQWQLNTNDVFQTAIQHSQIDLIRWLLDNNYQPTASLNLSSPSQEALDCFEVKQLEQWKGD